MTIWKRVRFSSLKTDVAEVMNTSSQATSGLSNPALSRPNWTKGRCTWHMPYFFHQRCNVAIEHCLIKLMLSFLRKNLMISSASLWVVLFTQKFWLVLDQLFRRRPPWHPPQPNLKSHNQPAQANLQGGTVCVIRSQWSQKPRKGLVLNEINQLCLEQLLV